MQSLLRLEFLLGATPCSVNSAGSSRGFRLQAKSPRYGLEADLRQVLDRTNALHGPRTQAYGETKYKKEFSKVLDRTKALHGPRTQAYWETKYKEEVLQMSDRTKALHGLRTQAYGETKYANEKPNTQKHDRSTLLPVR